MRVLLFLLAILGGIVGGILSQNLKLPFSKGQLTPAINVIKERQQIIPGNGKIVKSIAKVKDTVLKVSTQTASGKILEGSGLILTADGLFVTLAQLLPRGANFSFKSQEKSFNFQILKRDLQKNLALVKLESVGFPTASFKDDLNLGEEIFIVGQVGNQTRVNVGIVSSLEENFILANIFEDDIMSGSGAFDIEGKIIGLVFIEKGRVKIIPVNILRQFAGL